MDAFDRKLAQTRILVVEDNSFMRSLTIQILKSLGVNAIFSAANGQAAKAEIKTWIPHLVITDWNIEPVNGLELIQWIRRSSECPNPETPVILLTARNMAQDIEQARDYGVYDFIVKPVTPQAVQQKIRAALESERPFIRARVYVGPDRRRRKDTVYRGPLRRLTDPVNVEAEDTEDPRQEQFKTEIAALAQVCEKVDPFDVKQIRRIQTAIRSVRTSADALLDDDIDKVIDSLDEYVAASEDIILFEADIVKIHLDAVSRLLAIDDHQDPARDALVKGLAKIVTKRLAQNIAG
ncbi:MAG: response regulator [Maricaulaceae bacterium]